MLKVLLIRQWSINQKFNVYMHCYAFLSDESLPVHVTLLLYTYSKSSRFTVV